MLSSQICAHETRQLARGSIVLGTNEPHAGLLLDKGHTLHKELVCIRIETTIGSAVAPRRQQQVERDARGRSRCRRAPHCQRNRAREDSNHSHRTSETSADAPETTWQTTRDKCWRESARRGQSGRRAIAASHAQQHRHRDEVSAHCDRIRAAAVDLTRMQTSEATSYFAATVENFPFAKSCRHCDTKSSKGSRSNTNTCTGRIDHHPTHARPQSRPRPTQSCTALADSIIC
jgi:hypothetical protein